MVWEIQETSARFTLLWPRTATLRTAFVQDTLVRAMRVKGMTLFRNASDFIPRTMIPLTELAVGNATGRADLARRNLTQA
jgi:ABC-type iron transport system FetAB permease component